MRFDVHLHPTVLEQIQHHDERMKSCQEQPPLPDY
jgi:hypothetical protein